MLLLGSEVAPQCLAKECLYTFCVAFGHRYGYPHTQYGCELLKFGCTNGINIEIELVSEQQRRLKGS